MKYEFTINFWNRFLISNTSKILQKAKKTNEGFSLLELSIGVGITLILTLSGVMAYANLNTNSRQSAANQAAESAYNKAMSFELDNDSKTTPKQVEEEYNSKNDGIVVDVEELGAGRVKVVATYSDGITQATRITPVSGSSSDNGGEYIPDEDEDSTQIKDNISEIALQCTSTKTGRLPIWNIGNDTEIVLVDDNGDRTEVETIPADSSTFRIGNGVSQEIYKGIYNGTEVVTLQAERSYRLIVVGEIERIAGYSEKDDISRINTCIKSVPKLGEDSGITTISHLGSVSNRNSIESIDPELPRSVTSLQSAFIYSWNFQQDLSTWDMSNVENVSWMFFGSQYNQDLSTWNMANVETTEAMFQNNSNFNQDLSNWNISNVENATSMFASTHFNNGGPISISTTESNNPLNWETGSLKTTRGMFKGSSYFNQDISSWDMSKVTDMSTMFDGASLFNQNLNEWDTSSVTRISSIFRSTGKFQNGDEDLLWDTSNVTMMSYAFERSAFNKNLPWDTSKVVAMNSMFADSRFNQDISDWNVSKVSDMSSMFVRADYSQDLSQWKVPLIKSTPASFNGAWQTSGGKIPLDQYPQWGVA